MEKRLGSHWRRKAFERVATRDGSACSRCGVGSRQIWRPNGVWSGEQWGYKPWENWRYTSVNPTSNLELDHIVRLRDGGSNDDANLWLLCRDCHRVKTTSERSGKSNQPAQATGA